MDEYHEADSLVESDHAGTRADRYIAEVLALFPRSQISHRDVTIMVNGKAARFSYRLREGDRFTVRYAAPQASRVEPEAMNLDIIFEDERVVVLNKPAGVVVHPGAGNWSGTLAQGLLHHVRSLASEFRGTERPGIVHRLDKETSGVIIAAKDPDALAYLSRQFKERTTRKEYLALVKGQLPRSEGTIDAPIARDLRNRKRFTVVTPPAGKAAVTEYLVRRHYTAHSFVALRPRTGRTHQLRVHMASLGTPIVGDPVYARRDALLPEAPMMLHAYRLSVELPDGQRREFVAPPPEAFRDALRVAWGSA